jgi:hypothetical protein
MQLLHGLRTREVWGEDPQFTGAEEGALQVVAEFVEVLGDAS